MAIPTRFRTALTLCALAVCPAFFAPGAAEAQTVLYATGFESPTFGLGLLEGQGGFSAYLGRNTQAILVDNAQPDSGAQHLTLNSNLFALYDPGVSTTRYAGYYYPTLNYTPARGTSLVTRVDVSVARGNETYAPFGYQNYTLAGAGIGGFILDTDGDVVLFNFGTAGTDEVVVHDVTLNQYHTLTTRIDFAAANQNFFLDGAHVGTLRILSDVDSTLADCDLYSSTSTEGGLPQANSVGYFDNYVVTTAPANTTLLTGRVSLQENPAASGTTATFVFRPATGTGFSRTAVLSANGTFTLEGIPSGTYSIAIKTPKNLQKTLSSVAVAGPFVAGLSANLRGGDANNDNSVDALDLALLIDAFNSTPEDTAFWNPAVDFNGDVSADALDLAILILNFNTEGDP